MALNNFFKFIDFYRERFHFIVFIVFIGCFLKKNIYFQREEKGGREGEKHQLVDLLAPIWGPGQQLRHVP